MKIKGGEKMLRNKKAQSILEYVVILAVIVAAIIYVAKNVVENKAKDLYGEKGAGKVIVDATTELADKNLISKGNSGQGIINPGIPYIDPDSLQPNIPNIPNVDIDENQ
ncbi:MAG: hypothetical protein AB1472_00520 [Candidatus Omnitrophota bacterium]